MQKLIFLILLMPLSCFSAEPPTTNNDSGNVLWSGLAYGKIRTDTGDYNSPNIYQIQLQFDPTANWGFSSGIHYNNDFKTSDKTKVRLGLTGFYLGMALQTTYIRSWQLYTKLEAMQWKIQAKGPGGLILGNDYGISPVYSIGLRMGRFSPATENLVLGLQYSRIADVSGADLDAVLFSISGYSDL